MRYVFADCLLDTQLYTLARAGWVIPLRPKAFHVLRYLLEHRDHLVSKEELCAHVWPAQFISDATIEGCIKRARQAIGDTGRTQQLIQTRRGYGYRFVGAVEERPAAPPAQAPAVTLRLSPATPLQDDTPWRPDPARLPVEDSIASQLAEAVDRPYDALSVYCSVGYLQVRQGTLHQAIPLLARGVALGREADIPHYYRFAAVYLALACALAGRATDALPLLGQIEGNPIVRGEAYLLAGEVEEADRLTRRGLANARDRNMRGEEAWALRLLGEIAMRRDPVDIAQAEAPFQQALALAEALGMRPLQAHCHLGLGTLYAKAGQWEQARAALSTALEMYCAMEMTFWLPQAEATLAQVSVC